MEPTVVEVRSRVDDVTVAEALVDHLVGQRLAACGHIDPASPARYWWRHEFVRDHEVELRLITSLGRREALVEELRRRHPYELPGITWMLVATTDDYAAWVVAETTQRA